MRHQQTLRGRLRGRQTEEHIPEGESRRIIILLVFRGRVFLNVCRQRKKLIERKGRQQQKRRPVRQTKHHPTEGEQKGFKKQHEARLTRLFKIKRKNAEETHNEQH